MSEPMRTTGVIEAKSQYGIRIDGSWYNHKPGDPQGCDSVEKDDLVAVEYFVKEQNGKKYYNIANTVEKKSDELVVTEEDVVTGNEGRKVSERELLIIRQTCIKAACDLGNENTNIDKILVAAQMFEEWVLR